MRPAVIAAGTGERRGRRALDGLLIAAAGGLAFATLAPADAALTNAWAVAVVAVVRSDLDRFIIPDAASAAIAALGLVAQAATSPDGVTDAMAALARGAAAGAAAFALFWGMAALFRRARGIDGLGFGDVKLAGACAVWLTPLQQVAALEIACLAALAVVAASARDQRGAVPFGAFLAPSAWLVHVAGPLVAAWIERSS